MSIAAEWAEKPGNVFTSDRAERALLGALLLAGESGLARCERLRPEDFRSPRGAAVLTAIRKLTFLGVPVDALTVVDELERAKVPPPPNVPGWGTAVASLLDYGTVGACDDASITAYARIVAGAAVLRRNAALGAA